MDAVIHHTINGHAMDENILGLEVKGNLADKKTIGIQVIAVGVTGTPNGTVTLEQSNDGTNWTNEGVPQQVDIDDTDLVLFMSVTDFAGQFLRLVYVRGTITGGTLNAHVIAK